MPRRYATYNVGVADINLLTLVHQSASVGAFILLIGQIIFIWNFVQSWLEGPEVEDGDPWDLEETNQKTKEFGWYEDKIATAVTDGGDEVAADGGEDVATDGGEAVSATGGEDDASESTDQTAEN
jgi:cytochrome c oxidase subunit 1